VLSITEDDPGLGPEHDAAVPNQAVHLVAFGQCRGQDPLEGFLKPAEEAQNRMPVNAQTSVGHPPRFPEIYRVQNTAVAGLVASFA